MKSLLIGVLILLLTPVVMNAQGYSDSTSTDSIMQKRLELSNAKNNTIYSVLKHRIEEHTEILEKQEIINTNVSNIQVIIVGCTLTTSSYRKFRKCIASKLDTK